MKGIYITVVILVLGIGMKAQTWSDSIRIDHEEGSYPSLTYDQYGNLFVGYNDPVDDKLYLRRRNRL